MSRELFEERDGGSQSGVGFIPMQVTSYSGGVRRGVCLQFTPLNGSHAQLTASEVVDLVAVLKKWLTETR